jgi:hypothetical protein
MSIFYPRLPSKNTSAIESAINYVEKYLADLAFSMAKNYPFSR